MYETHLHTHKVARETWQFLAAASTITFIKHCQQLTFVSSFLACLLPIREEPCGLNDAFDRQIFRFCVVC